MIAIETSKECDLDYVEFYGHTFSLVLSFSTLFSSFPFRLIPKISVKRNHYEDEDICFDEAIFWFAFLNFEIEYVYDL